MQQRITGIVVFLTLCVAWGGIGYLLLNGDARRQSLLPIVGIQPLPLKRPYGMAPVAFNGFVRACYHAGVNPYRITQTIGDHPASKGYHKRDGVLTENGIKYDYSAATDIHVFGLTEPQIEDLLHELALQGFACWYRHEGKWKGNEHIHAIYALLPMKPQLRRQVQQFLSKRREAGLQPLKWEPKLRHWRHRLLYKET